MNAVAVWREKTICTADVREKKSPESRNQDEKSSSIQITVHTIMKTSLGVYGERIKSDAKWLVLMADAHRSQQSLFA